jgi:putative glutamine amidotransferase
MPRIAIPRPKSNADEYNQRSLPQYLEAIKLAGGEPVVIELDWPNSDIARAATQCDAVCLPGSPADVDPEKYGATRDARTAAADPARDNADELLLQDAYNMKKPILGICYGVQSLNVWRTGTLVRHIESPLGTNHEAGRAVERAHQITINPESRLLRKIAGPVLSSENGLRGWVNSSHHQSVEKAGDGLEVVARSEDGTIEAVESTARDHFVLGVQWHPERGYENDALSQAIFREFIEAAKQRRREPRNATADFENVTNK